MIHHQVAALRAAGVDAGEMVVHPEPLDAAALYRRGDGPGGEVLPTPETAEAVVAALRRSGFIDERGYLVEDPRRSNWRDTVREAVRSPRGYVSDESRRRRGRDVDIPRRRVDAAAATWIIRGGKSTPRPRRG